MGGYMGKILRVNLTTGDIRDEDINPDWAAQFIGGAGLAACYLWEHLTPDVDPLGPENPLVFMTGPLTGTAAPSTGRFVVCARSPLTGLWGESNSGGFWGPELKFAGYDGIVITGRAPEPAYLAVADGKATLRPAAHLWGLDAYETQRVVKEEMGDRRTRVACIGAAGESRVKYAAIMNDHGRAAGRTGMGAVMGAKNLKAIAVLGHGKVPVADADALHAAVQDIAAFIQEDPASQVFRLMGTANGVMLQADIGDMPSRHFMGGVFPNALDISGPTMSETILQRRASCFRCPIGCGRRTAPTRDPWATPAVDGPEYETIASFGSLLDCADLEAVARANHLCNVHGLDTISCGVTLALAYQMFESGVLTERDTDGLRLQWGDLGPAIALIPRIARREGFGALLADGALALARRFGVEDWAVHVKGLEVPMHDPRANIGMALVYATGPRGASHMDADIYMVDLGQEQAELGIFAGDRFDQSADKVGVVIRMQNYHAFTNSLIACSNAFYGSHRWRALYTAVTGRDLSPDDLLLTGERVFNLKRAIANRLGATRDDDRLPPILLKPLPEGGTEGHVPDMDTLLPEFYRQRGWDWQTGKPLFDKLVNLGLNGPANELWR
ncbi:MAG: aldehyde ferredoxin oxidoreductase family protein [Chloroflexi bacterium]|nr:aldehyde ferredoxin oxidoreductase family protein [Chloroflexota bacterium]